MRIAGPMLDQRGANALRRWPRVDPTFDWRPRNPTYLIALHAALTGEHSPTETP